MERERERESMFWVWGISNLLEMLSHCVFSDLMCLIWVTESIEDLNDNADGIIHRSSGN